jgi:hypothetical protein
MMCRQAVAAFKLNSYISSEKLGTWTKRIGTKHIGPKHTGDKTYRRQNISATKRIAGQNVSAKKHIGWLKKKSYK